MAERGSEKEGDLTPEQEQEQEQERFSTDSLSFEESLRRVLVGGVGADPDDREGEEGMGVALRYVDRDLTDEELVEVWESTTTGVSDGTLPTFADKRSFIQDVLRRLGR